MLEEFIVILCSNDGSEICVPMERGLQAVWKQPLALETSSPWEQDS